MRKAIAALVIAILTVNVVVMAVSLIQQSGKLTDARKNVSRLETEVNTLIGNVSALQSNIYGLQVQLTNSETKASALQARLIQSETKVESLQMELTKATANLMDAEIIINNNGQAPNVTAPQLASDGHRLQQ